ncbi:MAG: tyrosine-protein phosphatase [Clostridia bacterium]|nr:tyrosine-protein phosphatase [Clostridia bacterium]
MKKKILSSALVLALCATMLSATSPIDGIAPLSNAGAYVPTLTSAQNGTKVALLDGNIYEYAKDYVKYKSMSYYNGTDQFAPVPVTLSWTSEAGAEYYTVKLSLFEDLSAAEYFVTFDRSLVVEELLMGKTYYYQVIAHYADKTVLSRVFSFETAYLPRTIEAEGVSNTRDFGGFYTVDGKHRVRQGLIYRGGEMTDITAAGIEKMLYTYNIKTDLDLRGNLSTPLGSAVNYVGVSAPYYVGSNGILTESYRDALITEIRTFADPDNYPIYVHCALGRDRTGTLCFLINALCGVGEKELYMDYETSFFSVKGCYGNTPLQPMIESSFTPLYNYLNTYPTEDEDATLAERTEAFMKEYLGITQSEIDSIRSILLEEVA